MRYWSMW